MPIPATDGEEPPEGAIWPVFVGLQLVVFAFFAFLVAASTPDPSKTEAALDSLRITFAAAAPAVGDADGLFDAGSAALRELAGELSGRLRLARVDRPRRGDELWLSVPTAEWFAPGEAAARDAATPLLDRIVAVLSTPPAGQRIDLTITLTGVAVAATAGGNAPLDFAVHRGVALVQALLSRGAPPDAITVGIGPGDSGRILLAFRLMPVATPAAGGPR